MGYETQFRGELKITPPLAANHLAYLKAFHETRRMRRDPVKAGEMPDPVREAVGLPIGEDGEYFVGSTGNFGQSNTPDILDYNRHPASQASLWCGWTPNDDGSALEAEDGKNYGYREWLGYLLARFLKPWGYRVDGEVRWRGEDFDDVGQIVVINSVAG